MSEISRRDALKGLAAIGAVASAGCVDASEAASPTAGPSPLPEKEKKMDPTVPALLKSTALPPRGFGPPKIRFCSAFTTTISIRAEMRWRGPMLRLRGAISEATSATRTSGACITVRRSRAFPGIPTGV